MQIAAVYLELKCFKDLIESEGNLWVQLATARLVHKRPSVKQFLKTVGDQNLKPHEVSQNNEGSLPVLNLRTYSKDKSGP